MSVVPLVSMLGAQIFAFDWNTTKRWLPLMNGVVLAPLPCLPWLSRLSRVTELSVTAELLAPTDSSVPAPAPQPSATAEPAIQTRLATFDISMALLLSGSGCARVGNAHSGPCGRPETTGWFEGELKSGTYTPHASK